MRGNEFNSESAKRLAKRATEKRVMLFGIKHGQTEASFKGQHLGPLDAILLANDLAVSTSLTICTLLRNNFDVDTAMMLAKISRNKRISLCGITPEQPKVDFKNQSLKPADAVLIAASIEFRASLTMVSCISCIR